jgi:hypothetical protein
MAALGDPPGAQERAGLEEIYARLVALLDGFDEVAFVPPLPRGVRHGVGGRTGHDYHALRP